MATLFVLFLAILVAGTLEAFSSVSRLHRREYSTSLGLEAHNAGQPSTTTTRATFLSTLIATSCLGIPSVALAEADPALKGTKKDPSFEACLSKCMYECTKPKGVEQKSRAECLPECKKSCAKTKEQLMLGQPIKKETE